MDLRLNADQSALLTAVAGLADQFRDMPADFRGLALASEALDQRLVDAGFFEIASTLELGPVCAALAVERLARLPCTAEVALSMLVRPHVLSGDLPRPLAFVERGRPGRFVAQARTLLIADGDLLAVAPVRADAVEPVASLYAYPMGVVSGGLEEMPLSPRQASTVRTWLRIALAAEAAGLIQAAIDATVAHLSVRTQFGRPLGTFQALRHRLAECAVLIGGVKWLASKAAFTGEPGDAALAAFHAQDSATRVIYDVHQMLGAMGMTLEHPLHLWTYRLKAMLSDLGGRGGQAQAVAQHCFMR